MTTKVQSWGNSQGLRLNKQILKEANIAIGDEVDLCVREGAIVIEPKRRIRGKYDLCSLISQIPPDYKTEEVDWGKTCRTGGLVMAEYIPKKGDFVALTFDPQSGHEQKGRRPALVISNDLFNKHTGFAIVCPITNTNRNYPLHVPLPYNTKLTGVIMVDQIKSIDFRARVAKRIAKADQQLLDEVLSILEPCIY